MSNRKSEEQDEWLQDTVKNLTARLTKRQGPYDNGYIIGRGCSGTGRGSSVLLDLCEKETG